MDTRPLIDDSGLRDRRTMAHVTRKLSNALEGALAGGGDPATSPLYVFGPFLKLIVVAGVARVTFGASIWLAVLTVVAVSAMYRLVMRWVSDGSGGSGLCEEEFGPWAVKANAGVTVIEYTLTFLVSIAALVTFLTDRVPALARSFAGVPLRTVIAIALSVAVGALVNRGPRVAARAFGPATAAVLGLLWTMIIATLWTRGLRLPELDWAAFDADHLHFTLGGYARILALMTGIEIFANLVAAYDGPASERSKKAFGSLAIVMGTTLATMIVVGPAILDVANPMNHEVSVFTQTMDALLPVSFAYAGTLVGIAVLLSAAAASSQGLQNLALGLRYRHYIPAWFGQRNRFGVSDKPVWLQVAVCALCFTAFGTAEETYLALYAAGVFVLLGLTGWAVVKRLGRQFRDAPRVPLSLMLLGSGAAALLTTGATAIIFEERLKEGAWAYFVLVPTLFFAFAWFRQNLGPPSRVEDRLGRVIAASYLPPNTGRSLYTGVAFRNVLVPLDGSPSAEAALTVAQTIARAYGARIRLLSVVEGGDGSTEASSRAYLDDVTEQLVSGGQAVEPQVEQGDPAEIIGLAARRDGCDLVVMTTHGRRRWQRWFVASVTSDVIYQTTPPLVVLRPTENWHSARTRFSRLLVCLDGSEIAEQVLPYVHELAARFNSHVILLSVQEGSDSETYPDTLHRYLERLAADLRAKGTEVQVVVESSAPAQAILHTARTEAMDTIMMVSHGRGGVARQDFVKLGSVVDLVLQSAECPVFLVSALPAADHPMPRDSTTRSRTA